MTTSFTGTPQWPLDRDTSESVSQKVRAVAPALARSVRDVLLFGVVCIAYAALTRLHLPWVTGRPASSWLVRLSDWLLTGEAFSIGSPLACSYLAIWSGRATSFARRIGRDTLTAHDVIYALVPSAIPVALITMLWLVTGRLRPEFLPIAGAVGALLIGCLVAIATQTILVSTYGVNLAGLHCLIVLGFAAGGDTEAWLGLPWAAAVALATVTAGGSMLGVQKMRFTERSTGFNEEADAVVPNDDAVIRYVVLLIGGTSVAVADWLLVAVLPSAGVGARAAATWTAFAIAAVLMFWYSRRFGFPSRIRPDFTSRFLQSRGWIAHGVRPGTDTAAMIRRKIAVVVQRWLLSYSLLILIFAVAAFTSVTPSSLHSNPFLPAILVSGAAMFLLRMAVHIWRNATFGPSLPQIMIEQDPTAARDQVLRRAIESLPPETRKEALQYLDRHDWKTIPTLFALLSGEEYQINMELERKGAIRVAWGTLWDAFVLTLPLTIILFIGLSQAQPGMDWVGMFFLTIVPSVWFAGYAKRLVLILKWSLSRRGKRNDGSHFRDAGR